MSWDWIIFILLILFITILSIVVYWVRKGKIKKTDCGDNWIDDSIGTLPD